MTPGSQIVSSHQVSSLYCLVNDETFNRNGLGLFVCSVHPNESYLDRRLSRGVTSFLLSHYLLELE